MQPPGRSLLFLPSRSFGSGSTSGLRPQRIKHADRAAASVRSLPRSCAGPTGRSGACLDTRLLAPGASAERTGSMRSLCHGAPRRDRSAMPGSARSFAPLPPAHLLTPLQPLLRLRGGTERNGPLKRRGGFGAGRNGADGRDGNGNGGGRATQTPWRLRDGRAALGRLTPNARLSTPTLTYRPIITVSVFEDAAGLRTRAPNVRRMCAECAPNGAPNGKVRALCQK